MRSGRGRRRSILTGLLLVSTAACSGGGGGSSHIRPTPSTTRITVLPAADRIKLGQARLGGPSSCIDDAYCAAGIARTYGIPLGSRIVALPSPAAIGDALTAGAIDIGVLPNSSELLGDPRLTALTDDRGLLPATNLVPVASAALVRTAGSALAPVLDEISAELTPAGLAGIEQALSRGVAPQAAADAWLADHVAAAVPAPAPPGAPAVVIATRTDTASAATAALYAGGLARYGWAVSVVAVGGARPEEMDALGSGTVNLVIDETAPLLEYLSGFSGSSSADVVDTVALLRRRLADRELVAFEPSPAKPGSVFVVNRAVASSLGIGSLSDLARSAGVRLGPPPTTLPPDPGNTGVVPADAEGPPPAQPATLGVGSAGDAVVALQTRLLTLGYDRSSPSGVFSEATRRAVIAFQLDQGLLTTGAVDPHTARILATARPPARPSPAPAPGDPGTLKVAPNVSGPSLGAQAGKIYLAFADGPSSLTVALLDELRARQATATFFAEEAALERRSDAIRTAAAAGHAVGISEPPHDATSTIGSETLFRTAARTQESLAPLLSRTPTCLVAPYGAYDAGTRQRAAQAGLKVVIPDVDPQDWRKPGADAISADIIQNAHAGSIILLHDGGGDRNQTVVAVGKVLDILIARGFGFSAIPDC
ncbi:MAG: hypothetical protein NVSMB4_09140 [Acidimicrobiales bacterium]